MRELILLLASLAATAFACVVPGWPLARHLTGTSPLLGAVVLSLSAIFVGSLSLALLGLPISWLSLAAFQVPLFLLGLRFPSTRPPDSADTNDAVVADVFRPARWLALGVALVVAIFFLRAWQQPLAGYDTSFRWDRLARLVAETGSLEYYPARTAAHYALYFYPDATPPLVSLVYAEIYSLLGRTPAEATAWFVTLQAVLLGLIALRFAHRLAGPAAARLALLGVCASPLLAWSVLMGQETGLTALCLGATLFFLDEAATSRHLGPCVLAGLAAGLGAVTREYGGAFVLVGLWAAARQNLGLRRCSLYLICTVLLAAPWYLRVWHLMGNPVYPLKLGPLFSYNAVHDAMFAELRAHLSWHALPAREWFRTLFQLLQLAPLSFVGGLWGAWLLRRRAPWLAVSALVAVALWLYGMGVVAGGTYISLRMLSPALLLLAIAAGVALATLPRARTVLGVVAFIGLLQLPGLLTTPLIAKSLPVSAWLDRFTRDRPRAAVADLTPSPVLSLPGKILSDDPYVHAWIADRGFGAKVVPVWSADYAFLFDPTLTPDEQIRRLLARDVRTLVLWPEVFASRPLSRRDWVRHILAHWPQVTPGYYHLAPTPGSP